MDILLHICCGPCLTYPLQALREEGHNPRGFFYNPNIQPYREHKRRLDSLVKYANEVSLPLILRPDYLLEEWLRAVAFRETERCAICYHQRLQAAARLAKRSGLAGFTTTLLYSRRQKHDLVAVLGRAAGEEAGVEFVYRDFRAGWREGQRLAQAAGLYRQEYCGCVFSERDRFLGRPSKEGGEA